MADIKLFDEYPILVDRVLATILGLNEAIVLQQVHYWLVNNEKNNINFKNGRYWTFNSMKKWREETFPFLGMDALRRAFGNLEKKGILITGNFNQKGYDRTKWYTIDYQKLYSMRCNNSFGGNHTMHLVETNKCNCGKPTNAFTENHTTNTKDYTETTQRFKQQQGLLLEHEKEVSLLKSFLGGSYTDEYAFRIINLLDELNKDSRYLEEKIEVAKSRKLNNKQGYLIEAVRQDYKNNSGNKMNKFQNFNSTLDKYSSDELEEKIRQSQSKKFG